MAAAPSISNAVLAQELRAAINRLSRLMRQQDRSGLSATMTAALATLRRNGSMTHGELAAQEQLAPPSVTALVGKLEAHGLVRRDVDPDDRRVARITLTAAGEVQLDDVASRRAEWLERQLQSLSPDEIADLGRAADVLAKLTETR